MKLKNILKLVVVIFILSCEDNTNIETDEFSQVFDLSKITLIDNNIQYNDIVNLGDFSSKFNENQLYKESEYPDLNKEFEEALDPNSSLDGVVVFSKKNSIKGIGSYIYDQSENTLLFYLFDVVNGKLILKSGFPKPTINLMNKDIVFIANHFYDKSDSNLIYRDLNLEYGTLKKDFNDLGLFRVNEEFNLFKTTDIKIDHKSEASCGFTPTCIRGGGNACVPRGCVPVCQEMDIREFIKNDDSYISSKINIDKMLPVSNLYKIRDILESSRLGTYYIEYYYRVNRHFFSSIDSDLSIDLVNFLPEFSQTTKNFLDENYEEVIFKSSFNRQITRILTKSGEKSGNREYRIAIQNLLKEFDQFENLTKSEVMSILNE